MAPLKVAIIGAGPSGLALARLLHLNDIPVTVYESDPSPHHRSQGGTLDLHEGTGLDCVKQAGLWEQFQKHARYDGEAFILADKHFKQYFNVPPGDAATSHGRPEIDRTVLRDMLVSSLPEGTVQWARKVESIGDDRVIHFADGTTASDHTLLVGADGAWSKVRPLVTDVQPEYSGISGLDLTLRNAAERAPELDAIVNRGSCFAFSDGKTVMAQHIGSGELKVYAFGAEPAGWPAPGAGGRGGGIDIKDPAAVRKGMLEYYADWDDRLKRFTTTFDDDKIRIWELWQLPVEHRWETRAGVTLIGDAAHLMTVFAGEGVNQAMGDAMELANALVAAVKAHGSVDAAVGKYEAGMFARVEPVKRETDANKRTFFDRRPAEEWMGQFIKQMQPAIEASGGMSAPKGFQA